MPSSSTSTSGVLGAESAATRPDDTLLAPFPREISREYPQSLKFMKSPFSGSSVRYRFPPCPGQESPKKKAEKDKRNKEREEALAQRAASRLASLASEQHVADKNVTEKQAAVRGKAESSGGRPSSLTRPQPRPNASGSLRFEGERRSFP